MPAAPVVKPLPAAVPGASGRGPVVPGTGWARELFHYRVGWPASQRRQGEHRASPVGESGAYRGDVLLREAAQARRLSLRATLRDPFERLWAREHLHSATLDLWLFVDMSASMRAGAPGRSGCHTAARLVASAAHSGRGAGDRVGVVCAGAETIASLCLAPTRDLRRVLALAARLARPVPVSPSASDPVSGLQAAAARVGSQRALVFIVSDFQSDRTDWTVLLDRLAAHQIVPVVTWNLSEQLMTTGARLSVLTDVETGERRVVWMRRAYRARILAALDDHHARIEALFAARGIRALHLFDGFDARALSGYFYGVASDPRPPSQRLA